MIWNDGSEGGSRGGRSCPVTSCLAVIKRPPAAALKVVSGCVPGPAGSGPPGFSSALSLGKWHLGVCVCFVSAIINNTAVNILSGPGDFCLLVQREMLENP